MSITMGIFTTYGYVLANSGPLGIWTWPVVIVGQLFVALVFAALASRIPLAGYSYQWTSRVNSTAVATELIGIVGLTLLLIIVGAVRGLLHPDHLFSTGGVPSSGWFTLGTWTSSGPFMLALLLALRHRPGRVFRPFAARHGFSGRSAGGALRAGVLRARRCEGYLWHR